MFNYIHNVTEDKTYTDVCLCCLSIYRLLVLNRLIVYSTYLINFKHIGTINKMFGLYGPITCTYLLKNNKKLYPRFIDFTNNLSI
jgi:hypothetical protein